MTLFWCDGLKVIKNIFSNPVFANCMETTPYILIEEATGQHMYGEFMSADFSGNYQVSVTFHYLRCFLT